MKLRILIVGINYAPEVVGIAPYNTQLAEYFSSLGHEVSVLTTFPYYPRWKTDPAYAAGSPFRTEVINGVKVMRSPVLLPRQRSAARRILFDSSLAATALVNSFRIGPLDLVICVSPPLQLGVTAWLVARSRRARFLLHLQDIVPDAALSVGMMRDGTAIRFARRLESFVYRCADQISVISRGFEENLANKAVPRDKLHMLPNWVETSQFGATATPTLRALLGASNGETLVIHAGNMGSKQALETLVDAAALLKDAGIVVTLIGDGNSRTDLEMRARAHQLHNVTFLPLQNDLPAALAAADVLVLSQRCAVVDSVAPSKLLSYMAAGKPVVAAVNGLSYAAQVILTANCGILVPPEEPKALAAALRELRSRPQDAHKLGRAGRIHVRQHYERSQILQRWSKLLETLTAGSDRRRKQS